MKLTTQSICNCQFIFSWCMFFFFTIYSLWESVIYNIYQTFKTLKWIPVLFMELFPAELLMSKFRNILLVAKVNMPNIISFIPGKTHISVKEKIWVGVKECYLKKLLSDLNAKIYDSFSSIFVFFSNVSYPSLTYSLPDISTQTQRHMHTYIIMFKRTINSITSGR